VGLIPLLIDVLISGVIFIISLVSSSDVLFKPHTLASNVSKFLHISSNLLAHFKLPNSGNNTISGFSYKNQTTLSASHIILLPKSFQLVSGQVLLATFSA
jgi:hypothetical protein